MNDTQPVYSQLRLIPLVIVVAAIALGFRVTDLVSGGAALDATAFAAEEDAQEAPEEEDQAQEGEVSDEPVDEASAPSPSNLPIISLPSDEERLLLTQLRDRRETLDRRERQLDLQEQTLQGVEKRIDEKIVALQLLEGQIKEHLRIFDEQEAQQLESIVAVYQTMKAKDAAPRFQLLDLEIQVDLATRMTGRKFADILSAMDERAATRLTTELATRAQPPTLEDIQGGR